MPVGSVFTLDPFAMCRALPGSDYYESSATSRVHHQTMWLAPTEGRNRTLPTFTRHRLKSEALGFTPEGTSGGHTQRPAGPGQGNGRAAPHPLERAVTSTPPISTRFGAVDPLRGLIADAYSYTFSSR